MLSDKRDILNLTTEQLQFIPKVILIRHYNSYIHDLWDKLPEHIKADSEIQHYQRCLKHYNQPESDTHIDGPAPLIKDCFLCNNYQH